MPAQTEKQSTALFDLLTPPQGEVSPAQQAQYDQLLAQGMTPEQAQAQLTNPEAVAQPAVPEQVYLDQPWLTPPTETKAAAPEWPEMKQEAAKTAFEQTMINAIEDAKARNHKVNDAKVAEQAILDNQVKEAREKINAALGKQAQTVEQNATLEALQKEGVGQHRQQEIALAAAQGQETSKAVSDEFLLGHQGETQSRTTADANTQLAGIEDRANGYGRRWVRKLTKNIENRLEHLGVRSFKSRRQRRQQLAAELVAANDQVDRAGGFKEMDITNARIAKRTSDEVVGNELISALATPRKISGRQRRGIADFIKKNPSAAKEVFPAVSAYKHGNLSQRTARNVGGAVHSNDLQP